MESFDPKPALNDYAGKSIPDSPYASVLDPEKFANQRVVVVGDANGKQRNKLYPLQVGYKQYGESGTAVSDWFPNIGKQVDDLAIIRSMWTTDNNHGAQVQFHSGRHMLDPHEPTIGAWINYGLGSENDNLPGFITINPSGSHGGAGAWSSAFLPAKYSGTRIGGKSGGMKVPFIDNPLQDRGKQRKELDLLASFNRDHLAQRGVDSELESRIASYELAFKMQMEVPGVQDFSSEPDHIKKLYGADVEPTKSFGEQCLMARRFSEAGVRFVQLSHRYWDSHGNLKKEHEKLSKEMDKPVAGLISDLKQRGLLDETLVLWGGEFGRTPTAQGNDGRDHNPHGFTMFMAGGGIKPGTVYGSTDDYGYYAEDKPVHFHDLHATILHLMGIDHEEFTYRYAGRDFRLTDVEGKVVHEILS